MSNTKQAIPEPTTTQIRYSRIAAARLTIDLMHAAADALMTGKDMRKPRLPRASPTDDAVTARSLQALAAEIANYANTGTTGTKA